MPDDPDNRQRNRRLLAGAVVMGAALGAVLTTGTRAVWIFDVIAIVGALYVLASSPKRRRRDE